MYFLDDISVNSAGKKYIPRGYRGAILESSGNVNKRGNIDIMGASSSAKESYDQIFLPVISCLRSPLNPCIAYITSTSS
jgi:hypothetical protein